MRRMAGALLVALAMAAPAHAATNTTEHRTIADRDGDNRLEPAPGDDHLLRQELGVKTPAADPLPLKFFAQLTDTHVVDEESPLRVEWLDRVGPPATGAYRPHEGLSAHVMEEMVKQVRFTNSPVTGRPIELVMTTGDNTDNTQCNETRWMIDLMDGSTTVDPDSGVEDAREFSEDELCRSENSPPPPPTPSCDVQDNGSIYDGVRGSDEYYEPDSSNVPGADNEDGPGYSPDQAENEREAQRRTALRDFPGLFEAMNLPFRATGFDRLPWYGIFGNHDGLVQGNQPRNPAFEALAVGCVKVTGLSAATSPPDDQSEVLGALLKTAQEGDSSLTKIVPPDPRRRPLRKSEYIAEHFRTSGYPAGHGFTAENVATGMGNYSFNPNGDERLRFIVLDSISEHGLDDGNIDDAQFQWLHEELKQADATGQLAVVFAHHSLRTMGQPPASPFPPGDAGGNLDPNVHFGEGPRGAGQTPCAVRDPAAPTQPTETVRCLLLRHRSVIAFVNGHEHASRVTPYERNPGTGQAEGGFWEINTASHIDWPQQSRVIHIVDNQDGSLSLWGTLIDHAGSPDPGGAPAPRDGQAQSGEAVQRLASISRELSFNDPDAGTGEDGSDWRGGDADRNVELVVRDPRQ